MTAEENSSSMNAVEEGIPQGNGTNGTSEVKKQLSSRLSLVSKAYDVDGDGKLDEAEKAMRDMDKDGLGHLSNKQVYSVFQEQLRMQKQLLLAKRVIIFCAVLLVILAVANIGVAFAAAAFAKDTTTENNVLLVKDTGEPVATNANVHILTATPIQRRVLGSGGFPDGFVVDATCSEGCATDAAPAMVKQLCELSQPVIVRLIYSLGGGYETLTSYPVCTPTVVETITTNEANRDGAAINITIAKPNESEEYNFAGGYFTVL